MKKISINITLPDGPLIRFLTKILEYFWKKSLRKYRKLSDKKLYSMLENPKNIQEMKDVIEVLKERNSHTLGSFLLKILKENKEMPLEKFLPVLRELKPSGLVDFLIKRFNENKTSLHVNTMIITTIDEIGGKKAEEFLKKLSKSKNPVYRFYAVSCLNKNYIPSKEEIENIKKEFLKVQQKRL